MLEAGQESEYNKVLISFNRFLGYNKPFLNNATIFDLISSHGLMDEVIKYAMLIEDYERVISYFITKKEYIKALEILAKYVSPFPAKPAGTLVDFYRDKPKNKNKTHHSAAEIPPRTSSCSTTFLQC